MKTISEIRDEYAVKKGFKDYVNLVIKSDKYAVSICDEVIMKKYAEEILKEAAGRAKIGYDLIGNPVKVNRQSILTIINELK